MKVLRRISLLVASASLVLAAVAAISGGAASIPSGQRTIGQAVLEPVFNDEQAGQIGYILAPEHTAQPVNSNPKAWGPFHLLIVPGQNDKPGDGVPLSAPAGGRQPDTRPRDCRSGAVDGTERLWRRRDRPRPPDGLSGWG